MDSVTYLHMHKPFEAIGFDGKNYLFRRITDGPDNNLIVVTQLGKLRAKVRLFHLAPLEYWQWAYPNDHSLSTCRFKIGAAIADLKKQCLEAATAHRKDKALDGPR